MSDIYTSVSNFDFELLNRFDGNGVAIEGRDQARVIIHTMTTLGQYSAQFDAALQLFDYSLSREEGSTSRDEETLMRQWLFIAGRDGAITIHNFCNQALIVNKSISDCPLDKSAHAPEG